VRMIGLLTNVALAALMVQGSAGAQAPAAATSEPAAVPEVEESDIATLPTMSDHLAFVMSAWGNGTRLINGDTGKMLATIHTIPLSNVAIDPRRRFVYVAESIWTKGNRGTRQDMVSVYNARTLKLLHEIPLPGRLLTGNRVQNLAISADGNLAYIYDMTPAAALHVVDLARRRLVSSVEIPGCALAFAGAGGAVASLCGDGTLATIRLDGRRKAVVTSSEPFFDADNDPIFDNSVVDRSTGKAFFLSYSGLIYETMIGPGGGAMQKPWSIQEAGGMARGSTVPLTSGWLPGGRQLLSYHSATGRLFVLMHLGEFWSHKADGTELWVLDAGTRKLIARRALKDPITYMQVTQDDKPLLFLAGKGKMIVLDATTYEEKHGLEEIGAGMISVSGR